MRLLELVEKSDDPAVEAHALVKTFPVLKGMVDKKWMKVQSGFQEAESMLKGLKRVGSQHIEAPRVLKAKVLRPMKEMRDLLRDAVKEVEKVV